MAARRSRKQRRMIGVGLGLLGLGAAAALSLTAFQDNLLFFYSPTELIDQELGENQRFRIGGLVAEDSVERIVSSAAVEESDTIRFTVTDTENTVPVIYSGILPDLFREGQGVIAHGRLDAEGVFQADEILARHDENYMPPEVHEALQQAERLRAAGSGQGDSGQGGSGEGGYGQGSGGS